MAVIIEKYTSPRRSTGEGASIERLYLIRGEPDEAAALALLEATAPGTSGGMPRRSVRIEPVDTDTWDGEATYTAIPLPGGSPPPEAGQSVYSFETGGGTQRITHSKETIQSYARPGATAKNFKNAIGVTKDGAVEGCDIVVPVYQFSEAHYIDSKSVNDVYRGQVFSVTGKTNAAAFRGFQIGEVLFLGASGSKRGGPDGADWEISFRFAASPNVTGLAIGDITGIAKKGWEYLWVRFEEEGESSGLAARPHAAYVERVYDSGDFGLLGI